MPGQAGSPYWATVDFDSEGDDDPSPPGKQRVYLDPWDSEAYGLIQDAPDSSHGENFNSFVGEPVSASFYYVPTKNYDSGEEPIPKRSVLPEDIVTADYPVYGWKNSRTNPHYPPEMAVYAEKRTRDRRRSLYIEEPIYAPNHVMYEPLYGLVPPAPPGFIPPPPRSRMSLPHQPEYVMAALGSGKHRRHSRLTDAYEHFGYESLSPEYEDWARPFPKTAPGNFHLSRYGHLQIDYSCSWNSLDRLMRNQ